MQHVLGDTYKYFLGNTPRKEHLKSLDIDGRVFYSDFDIHIKALPVARTVYRRSN
jgi:hypothetical protein